MVLVLAIAFSLYLAMIPVRLARIRARVPVPQAIFVLGGGSDREEFAAALSRQYPNLDAWVSSGSKPERVASFFEAAGVPLARLHLDYQAVDTVKNFTTMVGVFRQVGIEHVYLVTSDSHMRRARTISFFVFGSRGIVCTPARVYSRRKDESEWKVLRDGARSLLWLTTGKTGTRIERR